MTAVPINLMDMKDICIKFDTDKHTCNQTLAYNLWFDFITLRRITYFSFNTKMG